MDELDDEAASNLSACGNVSEEESDRPMDSAHDLLRYGHGPTTLWAAATMSARNDSRSGIRISAPVSSDLSVIRVCGAVAEETSRRLRVPTPQCPYASGHAPPEVTRVWSSERFSFAEKDGALLAPAETHSSRRSGLKHRLRTTVWIMGNVESTRRALQHSVFASHSGGSGRPLPAYTYQHSIVRSSAPAGSYALLVHPEAVRVSRLCCCGTL
jgi:hypothetical protein